MPLCPRLSGAAARAARPAGGTARPRRPGGARPDRGRGDRRGPPGHRATGSRSRARSGARLSLAGVPVVSGLALGVDAAAHQGALEGPGRPVAVLAAAPDVAYPSRNRVLHAAVAARGAVVSELPPGASAFRWCFVARNRIVAALAQVVVIVEATQRSGSLTTADFAADLGCTVAAVPGRVTTRTAAGTNALIQTGAALVRDASDVLDLLADATGEPRRTPVRPELPPLPPELRHLLTAVEDGRGTLGELATSSEQAKAVLRGLGELELRGLVRRTFGGRYEPAAR